MSTSGAENHLTRTIHTTQSQREEWKKLNGRNLHKDKHTRLDVFSGMASTSVIFSLIESAKKHSAWATLEFECR